MMVTLEEISKQFNLPLNQFLRRADERIEWVCKCGVGHTVWYPKGSTDLHGCCGCCKKLKTKKILEKNKELFNKLKEK